MTHGWQRVVAHADMDAFYASIEQLDQPALRGKPILVGPPSHRGVVLTASYEARPFRVGSAMPMAEARRRCPQAIVVPPRFERYKAVSKQVMAVFADFSPSVEPLSLDEAFIDMSGAEAIFGSPQDIGTAIKAAVNAATGLTVSVGISGTKYVAKVASDFDKPNGLTIVPPGRARAWLAPLPVAKLWGAGPKMQARLGELGFSTIGQLADADPAELAKALGKMGTAFHALANARDARGVETARRSKSIGSERTLSHDITRLRELEQQLRASADNVGRRLRKHAWVAQGVRVKLKRHDFRLLTRQRVLAEPTDSSERIYETAARLLHEFDDAGPFRLVGVAAYDLSPAGEQAQLGLLAAGDERSNKLEAVLDELGSRFGQGIVQRGADLIGPGTVGPEVNLDFLTEGTDD